MLVCEKRDIWKIRNPDAFIAENALQSTKNVRNTNVSTSGHTFRAFFFCAISRTRPSYQMCSYSASTVFDDFYSLFTRQVRKCYMDEKVKFEIESGYIPPETPLCFRRPNSEIDRIMDISWLCVILERAAGAKILGILTFKIRFLKGFLPKYCKKFLAAPKARREKIGGMTL